MTQKTFPLSSPQLEIWFDQILHEEIPLYNRTRYLKIPAIIDPLLFEHAVNLLVKKHDALRIQLTKILDDQGIPMQTYSDMKVKVPLWDFSAESNPDKVAMSWIAARSNKPFKLTQQALFRYDLIKTHHDGYYLLMQYHHLIVDGYSMAQLSRSLANIYTQLVNSNTPNLNSPSYTAFIEDDQAYVASKSFAENRDYWSGKYPASPEALFVPRYRAHYSEALIGSQVETLLMPRAFYQQLHQLGKQHQVTFFRVFLAALYVYFVRTAQRDDLAIGFPTLNRNRTEFKQTAGLFTLVNASFFNFGRTLTFVELLQKINQGLKEDLAHQPFPISEINRLVNPKQGNTRTRLFDINVSYQRFDFDCCFDEINTQTTQVLYAWEQTPLMIHIEDFNAEAEVKFHFLYNLAYFKADEIKALQARLMILLEAVLQKSALPIQQLPIMAATEISTLQTWNATSIAYPQNQSVVDLFEQQVVKTPDKIALVFAKQSLSYLQLNQQANQLAHYLTTLKNQQGVRLFSHNPLIAVAVERCPDMVIALLAIFKVGGAYLPIDPNYPQQRIRYMLEDSKVNLLVTQSHLTSRLSVHQLKQVCISVNLDELKLLSYSSANLVKQSQAHDLAYVIYTSGSTGQPKGVMVEQHGLVNFLQDMQQRTQITAEDRLLAITTLSFDIATLELYLPLMSGSCLCLCSSADARNALALQQQLIQHEISFMQATPATWALLRYSDWQATMPLTILCSGEAISADLSNYLLANSRLLWNVYGPTETSIGSSAYLITSVLKSQPFIGQPIANTRIYIIDADNNVLPIGVAGELGIAGSGVTRGYLNRPKLTAEKFIDFEFEGKQERLYKTGDLAKWTSNGQLEYLGRTDHQIKLRGFRIELGEIEANLCQHPHINAAIVNLHATENNQQLIAYITTQVETISVDEIRSWLKNSLPDYMIPAQIIPLSIFPLTANGKINRLALPAPENIRQANEKGTLPRTLTEERLARIWVDILGIDLSQQPAGAATINIHDDFFTMGGHSLFAAQLMSQIQKTFQIELPLVRIFEFPTIAKLSQCIELQLDSNPSFQSMKNQPWSAVVPIQREGKHPPLFIMPGGCAGEEELINLVNLIFLLGKDRPIYGLQARGWDGQLPPYTSVNAMADDCVKAIRSVQAEGGYLLVGECLGGRVMLAIAQQHQAQGQIIK
jgi:amino acid adenylation domain-containing protein